MFWWGWGSLFSFFPEIHGISLIHPNVLNVLKIGTVGLQVVRDGAKLVLPKDEAVSSFVVLHPPRSWADRRTTGGTGWVAGPQAVSL